jgi:hypothetical protein
VGVNGCVATLDACSYNALDVCADCDGATRTNQSLLPVELIMVLVGQLLL